MGGYFLTEWGFSDGTGALSVLLHPLGTILGFPSATDSWHAHFNFVK